MKNLKKIFSVVLVAMMAIIMLVSCGGTKATPEESAKIYLNALLKEDKTGIDKIGMKEEEYDKLKKNKEDILMKGFETSGVDSSIVTDEMKNDLKENLLKGITKLDYEVTPGSTDKNISKVNVKMKVLDGDKAIKEAQDQVKEKMMANPSMTQKEVFGEYLNIVGKLIADGPVKEESKDVEITLNKKDNVWQPDDNAESNILDVIGGDK